MFDSDFLKQLEYLSLLSKRMFQGQLLAQRRTMQTGGGIEFADHREYIHGDDLRYLDWNVYARHGDLLLKRFQEEEDLHVYVLIDASQSMEVERNDADPAPKWKLACQISAALAYIALADLDRVAIYAYADGIKAAMPLVRGKDQILSILRFLENVKCSGEKTDLQRSVGEFITRSPRTGLAVVVSDLFDQDGFREGVDRLRYAKFEPHVIQLHTPAEADPNLLGDVQLVDCETGTEKKVTVTERKLRQYKELFAKFLGEVETYCRQYGLAHTRTSTDIPFDAVLLKMMRTAAVG